MGKMLNVLPQYVRRQMCLLLLHLFIVTLEVLTRAIRQESKMKTYRLEKKKKVYLFEDGIIVFKVNPPKYLKIYILELPRSTAIL